MDREYKCGQMALNMRVNGVKIKRMEKESFGMQMVMYTKDNG